MERTIPILSVKLKMPQPRKNYIIRRMLFDQLEQLKECKVTIIKAGAGSGKTTLLTSFIKETNLDHVKWITLDDNANQAFVFWNYVIEAVKEYLEDSKADLQTYFDSNMQKENLWQILSLFVNKLNVEKDIVLVLDDFQVVTDTFLISTIDYFIENMPANIHLVLASREIPKIYLGGIAIEDNLLVLEEDMIRLTKEESRDFLTHTLRLNKEEEVITAMIEASEGWIGGLQLLAMATKTKNTQVIGNFNVSNRVLNDYITREIFSYLTKEEQEFLIETSILRYFNKNICEKYKPDIIFDSMMESILQKNLFVINIDDEEGVIYRYHAIMMEYLTTLFVNKEEKSRKHFHELAADIYQAEGDYEECLYHLFAVEEYEKIMNIILKMPQTALTFSYLMKVPMEQIAKNTDFAYQYFFYYYASLDEENCKKIYFFIKENFKDDRTFEAFRRSNMFLYTDWHFQNTNILSLEQIKKLPLNSNTIAFLLIKEAYFHYVNANLQDAIAYLDCAEEVYKKTGNSYIGFFVFAEKAQIYEDMGELSLCFSLYKEMEKIISQVKSFACSYYIGIAGVFIRQLKLDQAFEMLENTKKFMMPTSENIERAYQYTLAEYYYLIGEDTKTETILMETMGPEALTNIFFSARLLRYPMYRGQHNDLLKQFINEYEKVESPIENMDCKLLYASIQYELGNKEKALFQVEELIAKARKSQNKLKIVEGDLLKSRILIEHQGDQRDIKNLFMEAISYALEDEIAHPFWFEKKTTERIINELRIGLEKDLAKEEMDFITCILKADPIHGIREKRNDKKESCQDALTEREKEVLSELSKGSTNMQIADKLCVSLATVKSHINNIYGKLGVNNRVAAVNKLNKGNKV